MSRAQTQSEGRVLGPQAEALKVGGSPRGAGHQGTREAEQRVARAALKLAPPLAHARAPPSPSPKAPSQWASRKGRARERGTGRGSHARGKGRRRRAALDGQLTPANPPCGFSAFFCAGLCSTSHLLFLPPTPPTHSSASRPASPPPLCGQITAGKRRGPKRQARVEP